MMTDVELLARLQTLASAVDWPEERDLVPAVGRSVAAKRVHRPLRLRPAFAAIVVLVLALSAALALSPAARTAVARWLGFPGIAVEVGREPLPELTGLDLGEPVSLSEAAHRAGFEVRTLPLADPRVFYDDVTAAVHIAYPFRGDSVVLLTQLRGADELAFLKQAPSVLPTEVDGEFALWSTGAEHAVIRKAGQRNDARLSHNALLWASGGVTYRLEIEAELPAAVRLAERLR